MVEWAAQQPVGFSAIVSIGDQIDVDFGDLLDYFALDRDTRAILLYVEVDQGRAQVHVGGARRRAHQAGRRDQIGPPCAGRQGGATHTGALAGSDAVYDAAFRRAGLLRVLDLDELFAAAETLGQVRPFAGNRLAILTNGGGIGVLAVDRLVDLGGTLAEHFAGDACASSMPRCRRSGRAPTRSISPAMPTRRAMRRRSNLCSPIAATMPFWS